MTKPQLGSIYVLNEFAQLVLITKNNMYFFTNTLLVDNNKNIKWLKLDDLAI